MLIGLIAVLERAGIGSEYGLIVILLVVLRFGLSSLSSLGSRLLCVWAYNRATTYKLIDKAIEVFL